MSGPWAHHLICRHPWLPQLFGAHTIARYSIGSRYPAYDHRVAIHFDRAGKLRLERARYADQGMVIIYKRFVTSTAAHTVHPHIRRGDRPLVRYSNV